MADFHKLLLSHSFHPGASLPFHLSPFLSFSPPRRLSCPPIFCRPCSNSNSPSSSLSSPTEIVSITECSDGSFLFKFGDPSEVVQIDKDVNDSGDSDLEKEEGLAEDDKSGSISKAVDKERSYLNDTGDLGLDKEESLAQDNKAGTISKAAQDNKAGTISKAAQDNKEGTTSKSVDKERSVIRPIRRRGSQPDVDVKRKGHVVELTALQTNVSEHCGDSGSGSVVEEKETSTSMVEIGTHIHEESDGAQIDDLAISPDSGMITDIETSSPSKEETSREINDGHTMISQVSDDLTTLPESGMVTDIETRSPFEEEASGEINDGDTMMSQVSDDLTTLPESGMVTDIETSSPSDEESSGENNDGDNMMSQVSDDLTTSPEYGMVTDIETSSPFEEEASEKINDGDTMTPQVSLELDMSSEGYGSSKLENIGKNGANADSLDSSVHDGGGAADQFVVELMPKNAKLEAELTVDEEVANILPGNLSAVESLNSVLVDDGVCHTILPDVATDGDVGSKEICEVGAEQTDTSVRREEISIPTLALASGVASLTCPSQALTGAEDAYFVAEEKWFIVANIVGQWSLEGMKAGLYGHELLQNCKTLILDSDICKANVREVLKQSAANVQSPGLVSLSIAHFDNEVLHVANIGDTGFIIIRNGFVHKSSSPHFHEFNLPVQIGSADDPVEVAKEHQVNLDDGDVIIMATDGLFDNLYEKDIASIVSKSLRSKMEPKELALLLATKAQEVGKSTSTRCPFADEAQAAGYAGYSGGKPDDVTVIVSFVKKQSSPQDL